MPETHQFPQDCTYIPVYTYIPQLAIQIIFYPHLLLWKETKIPSSILQLPKHLFYSTLKVMFHDSLFERQTKSK